MRKAQKRQAEELLGLLGQVHEEIKKGIEAGRKEEAMELLGQCQDAAIQLGQSIEEAEGEGFVTIPLLEQYCEVVYQIYEGLAQGQGVSANKAGKSLRKALVSIENSVKNDIRERVEAVFLPYKASMWDSLESVWKAADEDPDCDAYVIPIPYFDKNPDGSFREEHYEGDLYPEYVPVTHYNDYDFAGRRPDMIFIHNPYDECNYVTSVHPFFYAKNLKRFTDKLVYIPYFILSGEGMEENFAVVPGVLYANYVIAQTEKEREDYIRHCSKFYPQINFEEKILVLGSPKIDKVCSVNRTNVCVPEAWAERIQSKKVIFYNTSLSTLLYRSDEYLGKMKDVFALFESREDVMLLWRPHPLMESTLFSMRPELYTRYMELKKWFLEKEIGIYDDTPDMHIAIGVSDGYYGDWSSVVWLYRATGKPVMIQEIGIRCFDEKR